MHGSKLAWQNGRRLRPVAEVCSVPPSVGETPGWSLRGLGGGRKLLGSDGSRWPEAVPFDEPGRVVDLPKLDQRVAELPDGVEGPHPEQVLFQGTDEALGAAVALRRPHESGRTLDAKEGEFLLEVIRHVLAAVVVADGQTAGHVLRECCEVTRDTLADWLQRLEARRTGGGVDADAFGRAVVDGDEHRGLPLAGPGRGQVGAPHLVHPVGDDGAVVVAWSPRRADARAARVRASAARRGAWTCAPRPCATEPRPCGGPRHETGCRRERPGSPRPAPRPASVPTDPAGPAGWSAVGSGGGRSWPARCATPGTPGPARKRCRCRAKWSGSSPRPPLGQRAGITRLQRCDLGFRQLAFEQHLAQAGFQPIALQRLAVGRPGGQARLTSGKKGLAPARERRRRHP